MKHLARLIFIVIIVLLVVIGATQVYIQLQFFLQGDTIISISPKQQNILTEKRNEQTVQFSIDVENRAFCTSKCDLQFTNLATQSKLDQEIWKGSSIKMTKEYIIKPPEKGTGQVAYEFKVQCETQKTLLCPTTGSTREATSFVTLAYELSVEEQKILAVLKENLTHLLTTIVDLDTTTQQFMYQQNAVDLPHYSIQQVNITPLIRVAQESQHQWQEEEYSTINIKFISNTVNIYTTELFTAIQKFTTTVAEYNKTVNIYQTLQKQPWDILTEAQYLLNKSETTTIQAQELFSSFPVANYTAQQIDAQNLLNDFEKSFNVTETNFINHLIEEIELQQNNSDINYTVPVTLTNALALHREFCLSFHPNCTPPVQELFFNASFIQLPTKNATSIITPLLQEHVSICCIFGTCQECTHESEVVILLHGIAILQSAPLEYSLGGFQKLQQAFIKDGFINAGVILPTTTPQRIGRFGKPIVVSTSYYTDPKTGALSKNESIETYANRLASSINAIQQQTNATSITLIAHSMGGLVAREYLRVYTNNSVDTLIMLATPNKGIQGTIETICPVTAASIECREMTSTSAFINRLNAPSPTSTKLYVLYGTGCSMNGKDGDGTVRKENAQLSTAFNIPIHGTCGSVTLHEEIKDVQKYPEVYDIIKNIMIQ